MRERNPDRWKYLQLHEFPENGLGNGVFQPRLWRKMRERGREERHSELPRGRNGNRYRERCINSDRDRQRRTDCQTQKDLSKHSCNNLSRLAIFCSRRARRRKRKRKRGRNMENGNEIKEKLRYTMHNVYYNNVYFTWQLELRYRLTLGNREWDDLCGQSWTLSHVYR